MIESFILISMSQALTIFFSDLRLAGAKSC